MGGGHHIGQRVACRFRIAVAAEGAGIGGGVAADRGSEGVILRIAVAAARAGVGVRRSIARVGSAAVAVTQRIHIHIIHNRAAIVTDFLCIAGGGTGSFHRLNGGIGMRAGSLQGGRIIRCSGCLKQIAGIVGVLRVSAEGLVACVVGEAPRSICRRSDLPHTCC